MDNEHSQIGINTEKYIMHYYTPKRHTFSQALIFKGFNFRRWQLLLGIFRRHLNFLWILQLHDLFNN